MLFSWRYQLEPVSKASRWTAQRPVQRACISTEEKGARQPFRQMIGIVHGTTQRLHGLCRRIAPCGDGIAFTCFYDVTAPIGIEASCGAGREAVHPPRTWRR